MRIAVIDTGGIGGPYGASLAKAGADVTFVARGAHLAAMRENGLRIEGGSRRDHYPAGAGHPTISRALASSMSLYNPLGLRERMNRWG
jgi:ketopantoate reductase